MLIQMPMQLFFSSEGRGVAIAAKPIGAHLKMIPSGRFYKVPPLQTR